MSRRDPRKRPCIFGEVLFDHFPGGRRVLGGAPFNVAWHLRAFGLAPCLVSRVGDDEAGKQVLEAMRNWSMDTSGLQVDPALPTGRVTVRIEGGEPEYDIVHPSAWDAIEPTVKVPAGGLLYHGSLALRDNRSRASLEQIRDGTDATVFIDVNLRPPWWQRNAMAADLSEAHWVKLNEVELAQLGFAKGELRERVTAFVDKFGLQGLIVTRGPAGAVLVTSKGDFFDNALTERVAVKDTVGAGDAFTAVMILGLARDWPLPVALERALAFAAGIVGQRGAIVADPDFYSPFFEQWNLEEETTLDV